MQPYPNSTHYPDDQELPELFLGTLVVPLELNNAGRKEWEDVRRQARREEVEWGRRMEGE